MMLLARSYGLVCAALLGIHTMALSSVSKKRPTGIGRDLNRILQDIVTSKIPQLDDATSRLPFPDGPCGGTIVTIPNLYESQKRLLPSRDVQVWLPPNYHSSPNTRYPVLYVHDGQNALRDESSWTGASWRLAGGALSTLQYQNLPPPLLVLLPSASGDWLPGVRRRHLEYASLNSPFASAHADLVAKTIKPYMDTHFRTFADSNSTFAMGSSLGGQASINLLLRYPDLFGGVACLSPYFAPDTIASVGAASLSGKLHNKRLYMDIGGDSDKVKVPMFELQDHLTVTNGWNPGYFWLDTSLQQNVDAMKWAGRVALAHVEVRSFPGARHNERAWSKRIHWPIEFLLGKR